MLHLSVPRRKPRPDFVRVILERSHPAAICHVSSLINDVEPFRPRGVGEISAIAHVIDTERNGILEALREIIRDGQALFQRFRLCVTDILFHVGLHLPFVGGMRFPHVDGQKIHMIFVIVVNLNHVPDVAPKRRSGKAAEHEHQGPTRRALPNMKPRRPIQRH